MECNSGTFKRKIVCVLPAVLISDALNLAWRTFEVFLDCDVKRLICLSYIDGMLAFSTIVCPQLENGISALSKMPWTLYVFVFCFVLFIYSTFSQNVSLN